MPSDLIARNNVKIVGDGLRAIVFTHGFGCDQGMWRYLEPAFEEENLILVFDRVGAGKSDITSFWDETYATLSGFADDVTEAISRPTHGMQFSHHVNASETAGQFVRDAVSGSFHTKREATGDCPHLSHPDNVIAQMAKFLDRAA